MEYTTKDGKSLGAIQRTLYRKAFIARQNRMDAQSMEKYSEKSRLEKIHYFTRENALVEVIEEAGEREEFERYWKWRNGELRT